MRKYVKKVARIAKRGVKRVGSALKKRYASKSKYQNFKNIVNDVGAGAYALRMLNAEKKRYFITSATTVPVGQISANVTGNIVQDITPIPAEGVTYQTRSGASIKMCSALLRFQFIQQSARITTGRLKIQVVMVKGAPQTTTQFQSQYLLSNPFIGGTVYDYNSNRNPDYYGQYRVLKTKYVSIKDENISGDNVIKEVQIPMKLNHHIRFDKDTTTVVNGQLMLIITCDAGNCSTTTASTLSNVPLTVINSGFNMLFNHTFYYYDN